MKKEGRWTGSLGEGHVVRAQPPSLSLTRSRVTAVYIGLSLDGALQWATLLLDRGA